MSDRAELTIKCAGCGDVSTLAQVDADEVRFFLPSGGCVSIGNKVTQALLDGAELYCECCQDEREERGEL